LGPKATAGVFLTALLALVDCPDPPDCGELGSDDPGCSCGWFPLAPCPAPAATGVIWIHTLIRMPAVCT
jgi:hypothetical protein